MDRIKLHEAAGAAGRFQVHALAFLNEGKPDAMEREGQQLIDLLTELGFRPGGPRRITFTAHAEFALLAALSLLSAAAWLFA